MNKNEHRKIRTLNEERVCTRTSNQQCQSCPQNVPIIPQKVPRIPMVTRPAEREKERKRAREREREKERE